MCVFVCVFVCVCCEFCVWRTDLCTEEKIRKIVSSKQNLKKRDRKKRRERKLVDKYRDSLIEIDQLSSDH